MEIVAPVSSIWRKQKLLLALFLIGIGGWFIYDGTIGYPKLNEAFRAHAELKAAQRTNDWPELAKSHGWSPEPPHRLYVARDLNTQLGLGTLAILLGLGTAAWVARTRHTTLRADDEAFWDQRGRRIPFSAITSLNRKRWETKGLADVLYTLPTGTKGQVRFDDYKYQGCEKIFALIESHLAGDQPNPAATTPTTE